MTASALFSDCAYNQALVHQAIVAWLAGARQGSAAQKGRGQVRGGGRKPWRQKGTGRARAGSIRSPIWRGGGVTFAASPRNHAVKINRRMYRLAMRSLLAERSRRGDVQSVESLQVSEPKTRLAAELLGGLSVGGRILLVADEPNDKLRLAMRNLPDVELLQVHQLNPVALASADSIVLSEPALKQIQQWLS